MASKAGGGFPSLGYSKPVAGYHATIVGGSESSSESVELATEVPVALVYNGRPHAVMMCTPADLEDFAFGFSFSERLVAPGEITRVDVVRYGRGVELQVAVATDAEDRIGERSRALVGRTGCGLCGVELIGEALPESRPVDAVLTISREALWRASESLSMHQPLNARTSSIHAAAWATAEGEIRLAREDVGRHNALDKVIGALLRDRVDASAGFFVVTSRASYELVQKTATAGVALLAAVSRPTTLARDIADDAGITLVGLLRGRSAVVYTHPERLSPAPT